MLIENDQNHHHCNAPRRDASSVSQQRMMVGDWEHGLLSCCSDPAVCESALRLENLKILTCPSGLCGSLFHSCLFCQSAAALGLPWKRWLLDQHYSTLLSYFRWWVLSLCLPMFAPLRTLTREKYGWDGHKKLKPSAFVLKLYWIVAHLFQILFGWKLRGRFDLWSLLWPLCQLPGIFSSPSGFRTGIDWI